jgi:hypothetical protein
MTDNPTPPPPQGTAVSLQIPEETQRKFGDLLLLIQGSESMNIEERQYWVNILPIMTPDQLKSLQDILANEKKQLQAIDEKYSKEMQKLGTTEVTQKTGEDRRKKRETLQSTETSSRKEETEKAEDILKAIEETGTTQH